MLLSLLLIGLLTALGWWLAEHTAIGRQLGMTLLVLFLGLLTTNLLGWSPAPAAAEWVNGPLTSLAIAQLLLAVELRRVWPGAQRLLQPFAVAVAATLAGTAVGGWLFGSQLGADLPALSGLFTATFSGGSLNFVAVARSLEPPRQLVLIATAADHVVFSVWFLISLGLGRRRRQQAGSEPAPMAPGPEAAADHPDWQRGDTNPRALLSRSGALALLSGVAVVLVSELSTPWLQRLWPGLPGIVVLTTVALLAAQLPAVARNGLTYPCGLLLIQPFFTLIGLSSPVGGLLGEGRWVMALAVVIVAIQGAVVLLIGRWRGWGLVESLVGSQAAIGGPSTALALGSALGRSDLALPAVAIGLLGYLLGTYLGLGVAALLAG